MNRTRIAIGMSTALGVAATLGVTAAPTAGAQARGHQAKFTVIAGRSMPANPAPDTSAAVADQSSATAASQLLPSARV